jgi:hypothetical protein
MADRQDGAMLVQLLQWGSTMGLEEAMHAVWADEFTPKSRPPKTFSWCVFSVGERRSAR